MVEDISFEPHLIKDVEVHGLKRSTNILKLTLKIVVGGDLHSYPTISLSPDGIPRWSVNLAIDHLSASTHVSLILYKRYPFWSDILGSTETTVSDMEGDCDYNMFPIYQASVSNPIIGTFRISYSEDAHVVSVRNMIKNLTEVDLPVDVAWGFLRKGIDLLRKNKDLNKVVVDLCWAMFSAYVAASHDEVRKDPETIRSFYQPLIRQTIECTLFIDGYAQKSTLEHPLSANLLDKAAKIQERFRVMHDLLLSPTTGKAAVVTLGIQQPANPLIMRELLHNLQVSPELGPKSTCLRGTRVQIIDSLMAWIAECSGGLLWCNGESGSGKSSLMGTLRDLAINASGRSRLGAFIRYDRMESSDSSKLISSIAYSLGMYDNRIGMAISRFTESNPLPVSLEEQFKRLIEQPLQSVPGLADGGPLIVIIDGLDECNPSDELLDVLAKGFGSSLPFMRMIIASHPLESIAQKFSHSGITPIALEISVATYRDIRYYVDHHLSAIFADLSARHEPDTLQKMCEALKAVDALSKRAIDSFAWAATACRFIREFPDISRLQALLRLEIPFYNTDPTRNLYKTILRLIVAEATQDKDHIRRCIRSVLGAIMIPGLSGKITTQTLDTLVLEPHDPPAYLILSKLSTVVQISSDGFARFFHLSFYDFLRDRELSGEEWYIDVEGEKKRFDARLSLLRGITT